MSIDGEGTQVFFILHFKDSKRYRLILWEKKIKRQSIFIQYREMDPELNWGDIKVRTKN